MMSPSDPKAFYERVQFEGIHLIRIPQWRPTPLNELTGNRFKAGRLKKADREIIAHYCKHTPKAAKKRLVEVEIVLGKGGRKCDPDAYWKSLLDALVHAEMLTNDNENGVELMPVIHTRAEQENPIIATIIRMKDI